jgi:hypothetical protein
MKRVTVFLAVVMISWVCILPGSKQCAFSDKPLGPPELKVIWSNNGKFYAVLDPEKKTTIAYQAVNKDKKKLWEMKGWFRVAALANDGSHFVTGYRGINLLPVKYRKDEVMLRFYKNGKLFKEVTLDQLITDFSKLKRTVSHFHWGSYMGFDDKGHYVVKTVEEKKIAFNVTTGMRIDKKSGSSAGKTEGEKAVASLIEQYEREHNTHAWHTMDGWRSQIWMREVVDAAKKYPEAVQEALLSGSAPTQDFVFALAWAGGKKNIKFLIELCEKKPSTDLIRALGGTRNKDARPLLRKMTKHENWVFKTIALNALARMGDKSIYPIVRKWLETGDTGERGFAVSICTVLADTELLPSLHKADPNVKGKARSTFYRAMASCGDDKYIDELHAIAWDESEYERWKNERSPPGMRNINWNYTQNWALDAIAKLASPKSLPVLDKLGKEAKDPNIRSRAARIAKQIRKAGTEE